MTRLCIQLDDKVVELTIEQARTLYEELEKLFASPAVSIPSIWSDPILNPPYVVTVSSTSPAMIPVKRFDMPTTKPNVTINC